MSLEDVKKKNSFTDSLSKSWYTFTMIVISSLIMYKFTYSVEMSLLTDSIYYITF
jgi:hypothetical protein